MKNNKVLVIIVTYNAMRWASQCFDSLLKSNQKIDVYIIDNGSSDGTQDFIKKSYPQFILVQSQDNLGFGAANNEGFKYAIDKDYDYVYLLNQDAWIFPDTIEKLIESSIENKKYGVLSPLQYAADMKALDKGFEKIYTKASLENEKTRIIDVPFVMAAHWFLPIEVLKTVGGFSPTFFHYGEDLNFLHRVIFNGFKIGVDNTAKCVHDRFERKDSIEKQFYLKDVLNLVRLSNPNFTFFKNLANSFFYACAYSIKTLSIKPINGMIKHLSNIKNIKKNFDISKNKYAFLDHTKNNINAK